MTDIEASLIALLDGVGASRDDVSVGIGDDAAVLTVPPDRQLVSCVDALVEGVHYPEGTAAADVGWRALAVNLSDLAAMGAGPCWATLVLSLPEADFEWVTGFAAGFDQLARAHEVALVGGDTVRGAPSVAVQLMGLAPEDGVLLRDGAKPGDDLWVSGSLGDAAAGLAVLQGKLIAPDDAGEALCTRFLRPSPRVALGQALAGVASAALDLSDGLLTDAGRLARASAVGLELTLEAWPLSAALRSAVDRETAFNFAATGGDDYELLFTAQPARRGRIEALAEGQNMSCTRIGTVVDGQTVTCVLESEAWMPSYTAFDHFGPRSGS